MRSLLCGFYMDELKCCLFCSGLVSLNFLVGKFDYSSLGNYASVMPRMVIKNCHICNLKVVSPW